ncbi:hypothetical protein ACFQ1S_05995 [Kibdelosporangium lantanae]|uniref:Uncharacterized protein n=1 Tax=Kibdelosporangium lantanae TaxID=1497396 RepID=A0ABW3M3D7_9PSEU
MSRITHWINGKPWDGPAERTGEVYDPATGQVSGVVDRVVGYMATTRYRGMATTPQALSIHWNRGDGLMPRRS